MDNKEKRLGGPCGKCHQHHASNKTCKEHAVEIDSRMNRIVNIARTRLADNKDKRIRLATAQGWKEVLGGPGSWYPPGLPPQGNVLSHKLPDPFTNAADDFACLQHMIEKYEPDLIEAAFDHQGFGHRWVYEIGNYGEALLDIHDGNVQVCPDCLKTLDHKEE